MPLYGTIDARLDGDHPKALNAPSSDEIGGRDVQPMSFIYWRRGRLNGRGKRHDGGKCDVSHRDGRELRPLIRIRSLNGKDA